MTDFLWLVLSAPVWFNIVLVACAVTACLAFGLRELTAPSAWAMLAVFFVWVAASNSWHLLPKPRDVEGYAEMTEAVRAEMWRMWSVQLRETLIIADKAAAAVTLGVLSWLVWGAYTRSVRFTLLTALYAFVAFVAKVGNVMERYVCSANSPDLGNEHLYWAAGRRAEACGRLFADVFALPAGETIGPLVFPAITALPLPVVLAWVWWKKTRLQG